MLWHQYEHWCSHFQVITLGKQNVLRYNIINGYIPSLLNNIHFSLCLSPSHRVCMRDAKKSCEERGNKEMWFKSNETSTISFKWATFGGGVFICPGVQLKVFWKGCFCILSFMAISLLIGAEISALGWIATRWTRMTSGSSQVLMRGILWMYPTSIPPRGRSGNQMAADASQSSLTACIRNNHESGRPH